MKDKRMLIVIIALALVFVVIGSNMYIGEKQKKETVSNYYNYYTDSETNGTTYIVVFGKSGCSYCTKYLPVLNEVLSASNLTYQYLNIGILEDDVSKAMLTKAGVSIDDFGTPTTIIIKDGKCTAQHIGYMDADTTKAFFVENGLIGA